MMTTAKFLLIAIGAISLAWTASAENEATYTPDGRLFIPHLNRLDAAGDPIVSYEITLQKESDEWRFSVAGETVIPFDIPEPGNGSILNSSGRMYIPHARLLNTQGQTVRNYSVYMRKDSHGRFRIYGLTDLGSTYGTDTNTTDSTGTDTNTTDTTGTDTNTTDTTSTDTNTTDTTTACTTNLADVAGTWDFSFGWQFSHSFSGADFESTNNITPSSYTIQMTLDQTDEDVTGIGTADSVEYTLSGQVAGDLFSFSLLAGYTNQVMGLLSVHTVVDEAGYMDGDYYGTITNDTSTIRSGEFSATKQ